MYNDIIAVVNSHVIPYAGGTISPQENSVRVNAIRRGILAQIINDGFRDADNNDLLIRFTMPTPIADLDHKTESKSFRQWLEDCATDEELSRYNIPSSTVIKCNTSSLVNVDVLTPFFSFRTWVSIGYPTRAHISGSHLREETLAEVDLRWDTVDIISALFNQLESSLNVGAVYGLTRWPRRRFLSPTWTVSTCANQNNCIYSSRHNILIHSVFSRIHLLYCTERMHQVQ